MTDEEIHNIYLHMSGKAEGLVEATGKADFPVLFARAILEYEERTKDVPVAWEQFYPDIGKPQIAFNPEVVEYVAPQRTWVGLTEEDLKLLSAEYRIVYGSWVGDFAKAIEAKLKERNT
jgi:hypothetical protein